MSAAAVQAPSVGNATLSGKAKTVDATEEAYWQPAMELPCRIAVELSVPKFKVSDFLRLKVGSVVSTFWRASRDVPLRVNGTVIAWCEFEAAGNALAVRLTELV